MSRWWLRCLLVGLAGFSVTLAVVVHPTLAPGYPAPALRAVLETSISIIGSLVAFLVLGRYRRSRRPTDLAISVALFTEALSTPIFIGIPLLVGQKGLTDLAVGMFLAARMSSALLLWWASGRVATGAAAPATPAAPVHPAGEDRVSRGMRVVSVLGVAAIVLLLFFRDDPGASGVGVATPGLPRPLSSPGIAAVELACFLLYTAAAARFARQTACAVDALLGWMSLGCAFIAVASLDYALFPSLSWDKLHLGDFFRAAAVLAFAFGAEAEIRSYWQQMRQAARSDERRAVARDLHDGIAQELAFLATLVREPVIAGAEQGWLLQLRSATDRALAESRRAIASLVSEASTGLSGDLEQVLREVSAGWSAEIDLDVEPSGFDPRSREALIRIVREAVINAVRHGRARSIRVHLRQGEGAILRVVDDGTGFDPATAVERHDRFGLVMMRERAESIGARFEVRSRPGAGTTVELTWSTAALSAS